MKTKKPIPLIIFLLLASLTIASCSENSNNSSGEENTAPTPNKSELEDEVWHMEELYWEYAQNNDTVTYRTLWHEDFMGYPGFAEEVADISRIGIWIPELHKDPDLKFSYTLRKKGSNAIGDVVMVFYDTDYFWKNNQNEIVRRQTFKFTHTWKKVDEKWLILGGMAALKNQDVLVD
jgi:predicted small secreted protein